MSEEHPEDLPKTKPGFSRIPPKPPTLTARDLGDDTSPHPITVSLTEHRRLPDKSETSLPIADFTFDSSRSNHDNKIVTLRDIAPLFISVSYLANKGGMLSVTVNQLGRDLASLHSRAPFNAFSTFRLSNDATIMISFFQGKKVKL
jgi:hypothetical protein